MEILDYRKSAKALRRPNIEVTQSELSSEEFLKNLKGMEEILKLDGVGLAAPQVNWPIKLFMLCINAEEHIIPAKVYINPKINSMSKAVEKLTEGCLSFPDLFLDVKRPITIEWEYTDLDWKTHQEKASGFFARAILHETDHCNGKVFIDHVTSVQMLKVNRWLKD